MRVAKPKFGFVFTRDSECGTEAPIGTQLQVSFAQVYTLAKVLRNTWGSVTFVILRYFPTDLSIFPIRPHCGTPNSNPSHGSNDLMIVK